MMPFSTRFSAVLTGICAWYAINQFSAALGSSVVPIVVMTVFAGFLAGFLMRRERSMAAVNAFAVAQTVALLLFAVRARVSISVTVFVITVATLTTLLEIHFGRWIGAFAASKFRKNGDGGAPPDAP